MCITARFKLSTETKQIFNYKLKIINKFQEKIEERKRETGIGVFRLFELAARHHTLSLSFKSDKREGESERERIIIIIIVIINR